MLFPNKTNEDHWTVAKETKENVTWHHIPINKTTFYGPFFSENDALHWAKNNMAGPYNIVFQDMSAYRRHLK